MTVDVARERIDWLAEAASAGDVHTVRASWSDRLGAWRGKRLPVDGFLASTERRIGFCDGMIVVDVNCNIIQETPFSNFETGYPDMYWRPRLDTLRPVGWRPGEAFVLGRLEDHGGEPLAVAPRNVLDRVVGRMAAAGTTLEARFTLAGRLMVGPDRPVTLLADGRGRGEEHPGALRAAAEGLVSSGIPVRALETDRDGSFRLSIGGDDPGRAVEHAIIAKAALKEVARQRRLNAVFMTRLPDSASPSLTTIEIGLEGVETPERGRLEAARSHLRGLLQPSITAFKAGPATAPEVVSAGDRVVISGLAAAAEADPATALAAEVASIGIALDHSADLGPASPSDLDQAATVLAGCDWASEWLGEAFVENAVPLLRHEAAQFASAITDWELDRYFSAG